MIQSDTLKELRVSAGLTQDDLARQVGYTAKTISRWERGQAPPRAAVLEYLRGLGRSSTAQPPGGPAFQFVDLFAGIGGTRMGFEAVGGQCVFTSEWNRFAVQTYRENFGAEHPIAGDITGVEEAVIPPHEVLVAGFPCQPFSIAGVSKKKSLGRSHGFEDETQGTLFFDVARILSHHRPKAFLLENVKNLKSHDRGRTFEVILRTLEELGYTVTSKVVDGAAFVPQHRERVFLVGFADPSVGFSWDDVSIPERSEGPRMSSVLHPEDGTEAVEERFLEPDGSVHEKYVLSEKLWQYLQDYAEKHRKKGNGFGFGLVGPDDVSRTLSARYYKDGSEILVRRPGGRPRRLTPRECARLMGFDQPGRPPLKIPVSDTQAYKQFGNSVVVPVVEAIARAMLPHVRADRPLPDAHQIPLALS